VYSLRIQLRDHGIAVNDVGSLKLSPTKTRELAGYMRDFTRPLLAEVFGDDGLNVDSFEGLVMMFKDPDIDRARRRLKTMASALGIEIGAIPRFLEDYGDIFLSLSYYRQCLDHIAPIIDEFLEAIKEFDKSLQMRHNTALMNACAEMKSVFTAQLTVVTG